MNASEIERRNEYLAMQIAHKIQQKERLCRIVQAAHMAVVISLNLMGEADDIIDETKLVLNGSINEKQKKFLKRADKYCKEFAELIRAEGKSDVFWENIEDLDKKFRKWAGLNNPEIIEWHKVTERLPNAGEKVIVVTRNGKYALSEVGTDKEWKGSGTFAGSIAAWRLIDKYEEDANDKK